MSSSLVIDERDYRFSIIWVIDGEEGATLGEDTYTDKQLAKASPEDRDHILATITASKAPGATRDGSYGYWWESKTQAAAALRAIKKTLRADNGAPWPEWTVPALAAGWKPPKKWKP
jgi:hypothetical protein